MRECMDNFAFDITAMSKETFDLAMQVACADNEEATLYRVLDYPVKANEWTKEDTPKMPTLILYWTDKADDATKLPAPMKGEALASFVWNWLQDVWKNDAAGSEPDHDGSNSQGYRIFNEEWTHVADQSEAFMGIQPIWAMHGK